ncbi:MAG TPA: hypothetical protein VM598_02415 [Bdellovibrionota bacterium]|nr:hypothetical protein [Bdellovibrionota bacterium]
MRRWIATLLVFLTVYSPIATADSRAGSSAVLLKEVRSLRASIDAGDGKAPEAIDRFVNGLLTEEVSFAQVQAYVKSQLSPREYAVFLRELDASLKGIDPTTLTSGEFGEILGNTLSRTRGSGLSWSGCSQAWVGAGILAASLVVALISIAKNKIEDEITHHFTRVTNDSIKAKYEKERERQRSSSERSRESARSGAESGVQAAQNWETAYPGIIRADENEIADYTVRISNNEGSINRLTRLALLSEGTEREAYLKQIETLHEEIENMQSWIRSNRIEITTLQSRMELFRRDPGAVNGVIVEILRYRDTRLASIDDSEIKALARINESEVWWVEHFGDQVDNPDVISHQSDRDLARRLGIGAGIGAAVGGYLLFRGFDDC